jgi:hypothetical protein
MAGEIAISLSVVGSNAGAVASATDSDVIVMTGSNISSQTVTIGVATTTIPLGAVTVGGVMVIKNLSTTGTIYIDSVTPVVTAASRIKIKFGESALFRTNAAIYYGIADFAALAQVICFDN